MAGLDGFYVAYAAGQTGNSIIMFIIRDDVLVGADVGGMQYDGKITQSVGGDYRCSLVYIVPPNTQLITGAQPSSEPTRVPVEFILPADFATGRVALIETPLGAVNVRFDKVRDL